MTGAALPFGDGLVVVGRHGTVVTLDATGRELWEAVQIGCTTDDLIAAGVAYSGLAVESVRANVLHTLETWRNLGLIDAPSPEGDGSPNAAQVAARPRERTPALDEVYLVGDRPVRVSCDDVTLGAIIDAACGSCRVGDATDILARVDILAQDGGLIVRSEQTALTADGGPTQNPAFARHRCLTALLEIARPSRRWLGILHASAVAFGERSVVFPGSKGSGKSTLAAAMVAAGADFVTDDYAPLEQATWHVWPVPYAPGIKHGSWQALRKQYPDLDAQPVHELAAARIRYLDLDASRIAPLCRGLPVEALIFPRYEAGTALEQRPMTAAEAFAGLCHASPILDRRPDILAETLRWIESIPAYQLVYGDLELAVERVLSLLRVE
jgi:hypothetical protein